MCLCVLECIGVTEREREREQRVSVEYCRFEVQHNIHGHQFSKGLLKSNPSF